MGSLKRLFIEHWDIEKGHRALFIEGSAISSFSKSLGPDVVLTFSSMASSWVTPETIV